MHDPPEIWRGDLVNGVFSESGEVSFPIGLSRPGPVTITVVQQEFGVTTAVSSCSAELHTQVYVCYFFYVLSHLWISFPHCRLMYTFLAIHCQ